MKQNLRLAKLRVALLFLVGIVIISLALLRPEFEIYQRIIGVSMGIGIMFSAKRRWKFEKYGK